MYISGKNEVQSVERDIKDISIFRDNKSCLFLYKKTNKLSAGLYIVTNLLSDSEPLKWELRSCAQKLISYSAEDTGFSVSAHHKTASILRAHTLTILSLLDVALYANLVSEMNHRILKNEFTSFLFSLEEILKGESGAKILDSHFFDLPKEYRFLSNNSRQEKGQKDPSVSGVFDKGHTIRQPQNMSFKNSEPKNLTARSGEFYKGQKESKETRKESILALLKNKESLTIKDFSNTIKDCSEKTIQRELLSMVASGVLKKEGERRWSRYSLFVSGTI